MSLSCFTRARLGGGTVLIMSTTPCGKSRRTRRSAFLVARASRPCVSRPSCPLVLRQERFVPLLLHPRSPRRRDCTHNEYNPARRAWAESSVWAPRGPQCGAAVFTRSWQPGTCRRGLLLERLWTRRSAFLVARASRPCVSRPSCPLVLRQECFVPLVLHTRSPRRRDCTHNEYNPARQVAADATERVPPTTGVSPVCLTGILPV